MKALLQNSVEIIKENDPRVARIIIAKAWTGSDNEVIQVLFDFINKWDYKDKVDFILTPGGFLLFPWDYSITKKHVIDPKSPDPKIIEKLVEQGQKFLEKILITNDFYTKLGKITKYITFGVDSYSGKSPSNLHIELIFLIDLKEKKFYHTGKFYPVNRQEKGLIRYTNLNSHFLNLGKKNNVMILGCHDLNIFNRRGNSKKPPGVKMKSTLSL